MVYRYDRLYWGVQHSTRQYGESAFMTNVTVLLIISIDRTMFRENAFKNFYPFVKNESSFITSLLTCLGWEL